ncbi:MAG TPA: UDP-N-acetylmuramate--L-alanine ligase [Acidimicrobiia bacterium]|nr:UDP-N-acetylmuramate--L-alanine ligase [Acidimicrobiia bacterium]
MADGPALSDLERIHIVGIGGAGMSALARWLSGRGHRVTGSDAKPSAVLTVLSAEGMQTWSGHEPGRVTDVDLVVASSAVPVDDPELVMARERGIPVWARPDLLASVTASLPTIGATGTHGKTSTTAMMVAGARGAGLDPSFVVGGDLTDLGTNAAAGSDDLLILEVDEAFGTFEHVRLQGLVVTNIEADHLDHFGTLAGVEAAFERVGRGVDGVVLACVDDPGGRRFAAAVGAVGYGTSADATWRVRDLDADATGSRFRLAGPAGTWEVALSRPGVHMARNAAGALALLHARGVDLTAAAAALATFRGVGRRWDVRGTVGGVTVVDDYAHHPTEVEATLAAARQSDRRLVAVFQPHLYSRTSVHAAAFGAALAEAAVVVVLDVYGAREQPIAGVDGRLVSDAARAAGAPIVVDVADRSEAATVVSELVRAGDLVVCMGAGDIGELGDELVRRWGGGT